MQNPSQFRRRILKDAYQENLWHWIVRDESGKVLFGLGQERTEEAASQAADDCIAHLLRDPGIGQAG